MDAIYDTRWTTMYHAQVYIGLDPEFMVKAHLLIPEGEENILYSWMLNFQYMNPEYNEMYKNSQPVAIVNVPFLCSPKYFIPRSAAQFVSVLKYVNPNGCSSCVHCGFEKI